MFQTNNLSSEGLFSCSEKRFHPSISYWYVSVDTVYTITPISSVMSQLTQFPQSPLFLLLRVSRYSSHHHTDFFCYKWIQFTPSHLFFSVESVGTVHTKTPIYSVMSQLYSSHLFLLLCASRCSLHHHTYFFCYESMQFTPSHLFFFVMSQSVQFTPQHLFLLLWVNYAVHTVTSISSVMSQSMQFTPSHLFLLLFVNPYGSHYITLFPPMYAHVFEIEVVLPLIYLN
jgi:hypothetical protein